MHLLSTETNECFTGEIYLPDNGLHLTNTKYVQACMYIYVGKGIAYAYSNAQEHAHPSTHYTDAISRIWPNKSVSGSFVQQRRHCLLSKIDRSRH